jgi:hypothetical protein
VAPEAGRLDQPRASRARLPVHAPFREATLGGRDPRKRRPDPCEGTRESGVPTHVGRSRRGHRSIRGRARKPCRLQKSTGGIRACGISGSRAPECREPSRSRCKSGAALGNLEAGARRQSRGHGGGLLRGSAQARRVGSTCRWKALWVVEAVSFDEGVAEAVLAARRVRLTAEAAGGDRERQRSGREPGERLKTPPTGKRRTVRRSSPVGIGLVPPNGERRASAQSWRVASTIPSPARKAWESGGFHGYSCRWSVAEVGDEASSRSQSPRPARVVEVAVG